MFFDTPGDMDFCEPNFAHSHYIAEFWNTLSSLAIVWVGGCGMALSCWQRLGNEQMLCYLCLTVVGVGSTAFHATLMRTGQVLDEVPMLWSVMALVYGVAFHRADRERRQHIRSGSPRPPPTSLTLAALRGALITYSIAATALYFASGFIVFILMYALSVGALLYVAFGAMYRSHPPTGAQPRRLLISAAVAYAGGALILWLPGEALCHSHPFLERLPFHAVFHMTSAAGPHLGLTAFALARFEDEQDTTTRASAWLAGLPAIDRGAVLHKHV